MWYVALIQLGVPLLLIGVVAFTRQPSRLRWFGTVLAFGMVIGYLLISARWDVTSLYLRWLLPLLFIAAAVVGYRKIRAPDAPIGTLQSVIAWGVTSCVIILMSGYLWFSLGGYRTPDGAIDVASPLRGRHVVLNGGVSPFTNAHFRIRPQHFAFDILGVNGFGARASLLGASDDLDSYVIYGEPVFSPCDGTVSLVVDEFPDQIPPAGDRVNLAGNHVLVDCGEFELLLAHLRPGSLRVSFGDTVRVGDPLGEVGNSGNTSEPHLHIHAERGGEPGVALDGNSVPITIGGRFLVRNSVFDGDVGGGD